MTKTGYQIARQALREIGVLDPIEEGEAEDLEDALEAMNILLDEMRNDNILISGVTRSYQLLVGGQQTYTIGAGGDFDMAYPERIDRWSVVPDRAAAQPSEIPMGRPLDAREWAAIPTKAGQATYPARMWFDKEYSAGLGRCHFYPVPSASVPAVYLYVFRPSITEIDNSSSYDLQPGVMSALVLLLAEELGGGGRYKPDQDVYQRVVRRAARAKGAIRRKNTSNPEAPMRMEFAGLGGRR